MTRRTDLENDGARRSTWQRIRPIVAIGTSVASTPELQRFLLAIKPDCGAGFVVVPRFEAGHEPQCAGVLGRSCALPVLQAEDGVEIEANRVYLIPPDANPTIEAGRLRFHAAEPDRCLDFPIDRFLLSLAEDQEENAACVILPGTCSDGTIGVRAIKVHDGVAFAHLDGEHRQGYRESQATEFVDLSLPVDEIPFRLGRHFAHLRALAESGRIDSMREDIAARLPDICDVLRVRTGYDFVKYKKSILVRRIQRRMHVLQIADSDTLLARLKAEPREADLLFQDLLLSVTRFFNDWEALAALEQELIPRIVENRNAAGTLRVWIPGCATGEDAYAIAMLLSEIVQTTRGPQIQIFASDIDERALRIARSGRYPASIAQDLSPDRLRRHFEKEDDTYRVAATLRDKCLFTKHDLLRDPPFSRMDLVICRNVLVHLEQDLQNRIVPLLHYALREDGYLFMGESENVSDTTLFDPVEGAHRVFRKRARQRQRLDFPLAPRAPAQRSLREAAQSPLTSMQERAEQQVLELYAPAHVIITAAGEILYTSGGTGRYFEMPAGAPGKNAFDLARPGLRQKLRAACQSAAACQQPVVARNVTFDAGDERRAIDLIVQPLNRIDIPDATYMLVFRDIGKDFADQLLEVERFSDAENARISQLELDLRLTRDHLQTTSEELESSNEELRSANEELSSLNEELNLVNSELSVRIDELSAALSDMSNLLESTQIAAIFLDRRFRLRFFTPAAKEFYHLVEGDLGRLISDLRPRFDADWLQSDAAAVLSNLETVERRAASRENNSSYYIRIMPYRTSAGAIEGVVLTFVITM
jgi:two-component system, chemotaxis family, CheB/CheR fusion protein